MTSTAPSPIRRIVTGHNDKAQAIISRDDMLLADPLPHGNIATLLWSSQSLPADVNSKDDKGKAETGIATKGSVLRTVDFPPHTVGKLHRTISLDYVVVLKGTLALTLDDGSKTTVSEGDVVIQQATMHGWDNDSDNWARILVALTSANRLVVNGTELETHVTFTVK